MEENIARIQVAWELKQVGQSVEHIAERVGVHRSTVYRWQKGIRQRGIRGYLKHYRNAKKGRRVHKTHGALEQRVLSLRREYRGCCGQKLLYLLKQEGIELSLSTVYRVLHKHLKLHKPHRTPKGQPVEQAKRPREVIQMDTVDLGEVFAFTASDVYTKEGQVVMRSSLTAEDGKAALEHIMQAFGHVQVIQTDGGSEFEAQCAEAIPTFADRHRIARPYKKNEQAFIECFNGTLRREEFGQISFKATDLQLAQHRADAFLHYYHHQRPHLALDLKTPAQFVAESHLP